MPVANPGMDPQNQAMRLRTVLVFACLAVVGCKDDPALVASFSQTAEGRNPVIPYHGNASASGLDYKGICIYEDDSYAHVTRYWVYHAPAIEEIERGTFTRKGADSLYFSGKYLNMRGRLDDNGLNIEDGT